MGYIISKNSVLLVNVFKFTLWHSNFYEIDKRLAKQPPSAAFPSPSGEAPLSAPQMVLTAVKKKWGAFEPEMVLTLLQHHEDSEYVLGFEIGQLEGGFYSG